MTLAAQGKPDEAVAEYRSSITICDKIAGATAIAEARGILSTLHEKIGDLLMQQNKYADALLEYRQMFAATQTFKEDSARWHFDTAWAYAKIGHALQALGKLDDALASYRQDLAII